MFVLSMALMVACGTEGDNDAENGVQNNQNEFENGDAFPKTVTDDGGYEVTIEDEPQSVVSLIPSITEMLFALDLGDRVVGVSDFCDYPTEALEKEKLGGQEINVELLLSLNPDVAFFTENHDANIPEVLDQIRDAGITVVVVNTSATQFEDIYTAIGLIGQVTSTSEQADELVAELQAQLEQILNKVENVTDPKRVWIEVNPAPDIFTAGNGTFMHTMLETVGAINAAEDHEGWVQLSEEEIVSLHPDVILITYGHYFDDSIEGVLNRAGWGEIPAIANDDVYELNSDEVERPGPRIMDGVEILAQAIYPELFDE